MISDLKHRQTCEHSRDGVSEGGHLMSSHATGCGTQLYLHWWTKRLKETLWQTEHKQTRAIGFKPTKGKRSKWIFLEANAPWTWGDSSDFSFPAEFPVFLFLFFPPKRHRGTCELTRLRAAPPCVRRAALQEGHRRQKDGGPRENLSRVFALSRQLSEESVLPGEAPRPPLPADSGLRRGHDPLGRHGGRENPTTGKQLS